MRKLTKAQVDQFWEDGFIVVENVISNDVVNKLIARTPI